MADIGHRRKLVEYFKKNIKKGYTPDSLKYSLLTQGYSPAIVELALREAHKELAQKAPVLNLKPVIRYEIIGEDDTPITIKKSWWKRLFG